MKRDARQCAKGIFFATFLNTTLLLFVVAHFSPWQGRLKFIKIHRNRIVMNGRRIMPSRNGRRGRPRGSGLDDRAQLRRIAELMDADPELKPTTAIKALGVSDPSTIRRLRDKLKAERSKLEVASGALAGGSRGHVSERPELRSAAGQSRSENFASSREPGEVAVRIPQMDVSKPQAAWLGQLSASHRFAVSSGGPRAGRSGVSLRVPEVASALRRQLSVTRLATVISPKRLDIRSTLH